MVVNYYSMSLRVALIGLIHRPEIESNELKLGTVLDTVPSIVISSLRVYQFKLIVITTHLDFVTQ